jgi:hypothetical protein
VTLTSDDVDAKLMSRPSVPQQCVLSSIHEATIVKHVQTYLAVCSTISKQALASAWHRACSSNRVACVAALGSVAALALPACVQETQELRIHGSETEYALWTHLGSTHCNAKRVRKAGTVPIYKDIPGRLSCGAVATNAAACAHCCTINHQTISRRLHSITHKTPYGKFGSCG